MVRRFMNFCIATLTPPIILQPTLCRIEGISQRHIEVFMQVAIDYQLRARNRDIEPHIKKLALVFVFSRKFE